MAGDLLVYGDTVYFDIIQLPSAKRIASTLKADRCMAYSYQLHIFASMDETNGAGEITRSTAQSALPMIDLLLESACMSPSRGEEGTAVANASVHVPKVLLPVLEALPYVRTAELATSHCYAAAQLFRRWASVVGDGAAEDGEAGDSGGVEGFAPTGESAAVRGKIVLLLPRLQRALAWLRTASVVQWSAGMSLPSHVQSLMELLLAAKSTIAALRLAPPDDADAATIEDVRDASRSSSFDESHQVGQPGVEQCLVFVVS